MSSLNYSDFCRLCLVKERVSTPIFDGEGDIRRIFLKIATCLPIKVSREDHLPQSICDDCVYKVENQYQFWNTTANSEKQLHQWLDLGLAEPMDVKNVHTGGMLTDQMDMKQESIDMDQGSELSKSLSRVEAVLAEEAGRAAAAHEEEEDDEEESEEEGSNSEESEDDDNDADEPSKDDGESDEAYDEELEPTTFVNVSLACDEAGPSGTQQQTSVAPSTSTSAPAASGSGKRKRSRSKLRKLQDVPEPKSVKKGKSSNNTLTTNSRIINSVSSVSNGPHISSVSQSIEAAVTNVDPPNKKDSVQMKKNVKLPIDHLIEATVAEAAAYSERPAKGYGRINVPVDTLVTGTAHQQGHTKQRSIPVDGLIESSIVDLKPLAKTNSIIHSSMTIIDADGQNRLITIDKSISDAQGSSFNGPIKHDSRLTISVSNLDNEVIVGYDVPSNNSESDAHEGVFTASEGELYEALHSTEDALEDEDTKYVVLLHDALAETEDPDYEDNHPTCGYCDRVFQSFSRLDRHLVTHSSARPFPCTECNKSFKRAHELKMHSKTHSKDRNYACDICGHTFTQKHHLLVHRRRHLGDFKYPCDICTRGFHSNDELNSHKNTQHAMNQFVCETCGRSCANRQNFRKHLLLHNPLFKSVKKEQCPECGKMFANKSSLRLHGMTHTGENRHHCDVCGKIVFSRDALKSHKLIHTGEKPFVCDICGKAFRARENLKVHQRTHTNEKPFECSTCPRAFRQRQALVVHMRYHTGERPFKCSQCDKAYVTRTFLTQHVLTHGAADVREDIKRECLELNTTS